MKRIILVIVACLCALPVLSTQYSLGDGPRRVSGSLDFMNWSGTWPGCGGTAPVDNDSFYIQGYAQEKELYFTSDLSVGAAFSIMTGHAQAGTGNGNVFILDTRNYDFLYPKSTGAAFADSKMPLRFWTYVPSTGRNEEFLNLVRDAKSADAAWGFSKLKFVQSSASDYSTTLDFLSGSFNSLDPMGPATAENGYAVQLSSANIPTVVSFAPGFGLRTGGIVTSSAMGTLVFNGADVFCDRSLNHSTGSLVVSNGAAVVVGGAGAGTLTVGENAALYVSGEDTCVTAKSFTASGKVVHSAGTLQINGALTGGSDTDYLQIGGSLTVPSNLNNIGGKFVFAGGTVLTDYATKVDGAGLMVFSNGVRAAIAKGARGDFRAWGGKVIATGDGTTVEVPGKVAATGSDFEVREGATLTFGTIDASGTAKMRFVDGAIATGSTAKFGGETNVIAGAGTRFETTGTLTVCPQRLVVGDGAAVKASSLGFSGDNAELVVDGGACTNDNDLVLDGAAAAPPLVTINEGSFVSQRRVYLGSVDGQAGRVVVNGGYVELQKAAGDNVIMGYQGGHGSIVVNGGEVVTDRVRMGRLSSPSVGGSSLVEMNGGLFNVTGTDGILLFQNTAGDYTAGGTHEVRLNGGVLQVQKITSGISTPNPSKVSGNGGTVRAAVAKMGYFAKIDTLACGAQGLAFDTAGLNVGFANDLENDGAADGLFRKIGAGTLTVTPPNAKWSVSNLSVEAGELQLAADISGTTKLRVTDGAIFSTVGAADRISLGGLALTNATLALDSGDMLCVSGPVSVRNLALDWSATPSGSAVGFLEVTGELDDETCAELRRSVCKTAITSEKHQSITFAYDAGTGKTTVMAAVVADEPLPASADTAWTGAGAWGTGANWSGNSAPDETKRAVFADGAAGKTVSVAQGDQAGAVRFAADGYCLSGVGPLAIQGEQGAAAIDVSSGSQIVDVPVKAIASLNVNLDADTSLALNGSLDGPGFSKAGKGHLTLGTANVFSGGISLYDGFTTVAAANGFGGCTLASLIGGTLEFASSAGDCVVTNPVALSAPTTADMVILKTDSNVELRNYEAMSGALMKRGVGKATVAVGAGKSVVLADSAAELIANNVPFAFPADGSSLATGQYPALGVAEGELSIRGEGTGAAASLPGTGGLVIGVPNSGAQAQPELTVDNLVLDASQSMFNPGYKLANGAAVTNPVLRIVNGGSLKVKTMQPGYSSNHTRTYVTFALTNGTLQCLNSSYLSRMYDWTYKSDDLCYAGYRLKDSNLFFDCGEARLGGGIRMDAAGSFLGQSNGNPIDLTTVAGEVKRTSGEMFFRDGSVFAVRSIANAVEQAYDLTFAFDNAEWRWKVGGDADFTLNETAVHAFRYEMRGQGVVLKPATGRTFRTNVPFVGEGGLVVDGAGTVAFGPGAYAFTGACNLTNAAATADLTAAGQVARACFSGIGMVKGASVDRVSVASAFTDGWTTDVLPVFRDCVIGRLVIDAGRTEENPLVLPETPSRIAVAKVSGTTTIGSFRIVNTGSSKVSGTCEIEGDTVYLTPGLGPGLIMIVR